LDVGLEVHHRHAGRWLVSAPRASGPGGPSCSRASASRISEASCSMGGFLAISRPNLARRCRKDFDTACPQRHANVASYPGLDRRLLPQFLGAPDGGEAGNGIDLKRWAGAHVVDTTMTRFPAAAPDFPGRTRAADGTSQSGPIRACREPIARLRREARDWQGALARGATGGRARARGPAACWIWKYMRIKANRKQLPKGEGGDARPHSG
jgi:hypothetical protein